MPWRLVLLVVVALAGSTVIARATDGAGGESAQATAAKLFRFPALNRCVQGTSVRLSFIPPAGASFAALTVRAGSRDILQLTSLTGPGSVVVPLPRASTRVSISATTDSGLFLEAGRRYARCGQHAPAVAPPKRRPARRIPERLIPETGGGST